MSREPKKGLFGIVGGKDRKLAFEHSRNPETFEVEFDHMEITFARNRWRAALWFTEVDGRLVVSKLEVTPATDTVPPPGLTQKDLRDLSLGEDTRSLTRAIRDMQRAGKGRTYARLLPPLPALDDATKAAARKSRAKGEAFFASVAERYEAAYKVDARRPIRAMVEDYRAEGLDVNAATVTSWVRQARTKYGFLTYPERPGKAGGQPTKRLRKWQESRKEER